MVGMFGLSFGEGALEERFSCVPIMGATFRGTVGGDGIIDQCISWSLRSRRMCVIVGD